MIYRIGPKARLQLLGSRLHWPDSQTIITSYCSLNLPMLDILKAFSMWPNSCCGYELSFVFSPGSSTPLTAEILQLLGWPTLWRLLCFYYQCKAPLASPSICFWVSWACSWPLSAEAAFQLSSSTCRTEALFVFWTIHLAKCISLCLLYYWSTGFDTSILRCYQCLFFLKFQVLGLSTCSTFNSGIDLRFRCWALWIWLYLVFTVRPFWIVPP